jgi:hypothetical protein
LREERYEPVCPVCGIGHLFWAFHEMYVDNGKRAWTGNGFRYKQAIDYPNECNVGGDWAVKNEQTVWFPFFIRHQYEGGTSWKHEFDMLLQRDLSDTSTDEFFYYTIGAVINVVNHPNPNVLLTLPITSITDNGPVSILNLGENRNRFVPEPQPFPGRWSADGTEPRPAGGFSGESCRRFNTGLVQS